MKVRQLFAERHQQQHVQGLGFAHHQQQRRQRRRSLTGRDRSRPLRPLSGADNDPLCKTVCFTAPSIGGDVRGEMLALFGRLPNLGGSLWSESFRAGNGIKMKTAQSAPELKWLLDAGGGGPGGRVLEKPHAFVTTVAEPAMDDREGDDDWRPQQQVRFRLDILALAERKISYWTRKNVLFGARNIVMTFVDVSPYGIGQF